jgi:hypothetical protein
MIDAAVVVAVVETWPAEPSWPCQRARRRCVVAIISPPRTTARSAVRGMVRCMPVPGNPVLVAPAAPVPAFAGVAGVVGVAAFFAALQLGRFI